MVRHALIAWSGLCWATVVVMAQTPMPDYTSCLLDYAYPAGGQRGQTVEVELGGPATDVKGRPIAGLADATDVLVDGPPGIEVEQVSPVDSSMVRAVLRIAADAPLGRRGLRVVGPGCGATNFTWFTVGRLPEVLEQEKNNELAQAQNVTLPVVVNGRIAGPLDVDCFRFEARQGEKLVAAVLAHGLDVRSRGRDTRGFADATLEIVDAQGRVLADAADTIGLDPALEFVAPADGWYTARVYLVGYQGFREATYRLTLGDVAYPTAIFPPGGQRGTTVDVEVDGLNLPEGTRAALTVADSLIPQGYFHLMGPVNGAHELPLVRGSEPELLESEPNDTREQAMPIVPATTVNGRFLTVGDEDWYRLPVVAGQRYEAEVVAQRYLRSPVDSLLEVYDAAGTLITRNDDVADTDVEVLHDFSTFDSGVSFTVKQDGEVYLRVANQSGEYGPRSVYRLTCGPSLPDFRLHQWPDAVPIWGAGSTAGFVVTAQRLGNLSADIELRVEGLPDGWTGSVNYALGDRRERPAPNAGRRTFLTITAPRDAAVGTVVPFRVVGRAEVDGQVIERQAVPLTVYLPTDRCICRVGVESRAVVAGPHGPWLANEVSQLVAEQGTTIEVPFIVCDADELDTLPISVNYVTTSFKCSLGPPQTVKLNGNRGVARVNLGTMPPGRQGIVIARAWPSETRKGMPGPCTPLIMVDVLPAGTKTLAGK